MKKNLKATSASNSKALTKASADGLTEQHKKVLTAAGVDWAKFLQKMQNALPYLIALATIFLSDGPPVMKSSKKGCSVKESLECALHQQICATHTLCAAICDCKEECDSEE